MKLSRFLLLASISLCAACNSLDNPLNELLHTGSDARTYNAQTGNFEWPESNGPQPGRKTAATGDATRPQPATDGRYFDAQKNQWVEVESSHTRARKPKPALRARAATPAPAPFIEPEPQRPAAASGFYNAETGKIEWTSSSPVRPPATPAPKKRWLLF